MNCDGMPTPAALRMKLQDRHRAEQIGADHQPARPPRREHHQRQRDPAAAGGHARNEERRIGERQIRAGKACAGAAEHHREHPDAEHRIAERMRRGVVVADGAQDQSGSRPVQEPPDADDQREREIDEGVLAEQDAADERDIGQARDIADAAPG